MILRVAAVSIASAALALAAPLQATGPIDLDIPANLKAVELDHPDHFAKIQQILVEVQQQPNGRVADWMRTRFDARDVLYTDLVMTSLPPKKRLRFSLDKSSYVTTVTLRNWGASPTPALDGKRP
jgi:hypothetical protein